MQDDVSLIDENLPGHSSMLGFRTLDESTQDSLLIVLARTLAAAQSSAEFKQFLETEVKSVADERGTILMMDYISSAIGQSTFSEVLSQSSQTAGVPRSEAFFSDTLLAAIPNLTVTVYPGEINNDSLGNWTYSASLFVMPVTSVYEQDIETQNIAYGENSQTTYYSNWQDPADPVIIVQAHPYYIPVEVSTGEILGGNELITTMVSHCEELITAIRNLVSELIQGNSNEFVLLELEHLLDLYNELCSGEDDDGGGGDEPECDRDDRERREVIYRAKWTGAKQTLNQFCKWRLWGRTCLVEVNMTKAALNEDASAPVFAEFPPKFLSQARNDMKKNKEWFPGLPLYLWEYKQGIHADRYRLDFIGKNPKDGTEVTKGVNLGLKVTFELEDTNGNKVEVEFSIGGSRTVKFTHRDLDMGGDIIYYCDKANPPGELYTTGLFEFNMIEAAD
jgi:hypothetical protein